MSFLSDTLKVAKKSNKEGKKYATGEGKELSKLSEVVREIAFSSIDDPGVIKRLSGVDLRAGYGDIEKIRSKILPNDKSARIRKALEWVDDEDDIACKLVEIKIQFTVAGFKLSCEFTSDDTSDEERKKLQNIINLISFNRDIKKITEDFLKDWFATDNAILHWSVGARNVNTVNNNGQGRETDAVSSPLLKSLCTLDPGEVEWNDSLNLETMRVPVPLALKNEIKRTVDPTVSKEDREELIQKLVNSGVTQKWFDAVLDLSKPDTVELKNTDGEFWHVKTKGRKHYGLKSPSMYTIFDALETRRMLNQGEFSAAFMVKHFIFHMTAGESITQGPRAGSRENWAIKDDTDALMALCSNVAKALRIATNHTVKFDFVFPPADMFNSDKFINSERRILNWAGVVPSVYAGTGSKASEGHLGVRRMISDILQARFVVSNALKHFFNHQDVRSVFGIPDSCFVVCDFDEQILKDPRLLLDEIKALISANFHDPETALRELGRNPSSIKDGRKKAISENEDSNIWEPISVMRSNIESQSIFENDTGRPPNEGTERDEDTRFQRPISRMTENTP